MRFVDLFAGLGGFHVALRRLRHICVLACEIDENLREVYEQNFGLRPVGDIRMVKSVMIPPHDILCAGFPCQPFSKAGDQNGLSCPKWGGLFEHVVRILKYHTPPYFILENVPNLVRHDEGKTYRSMKAILEKIGYCVDEACLSPHHFGIPQIRERVYIVGSLDGLEGFLWPKRKPSIETSILSALEKNPKEARKLPPQVEACLETWQDFIQRFPKSLELPSFPIWSMEFGATYPYENLTPYAVGLSRLKDYRGSHGKVFKDLVPEDRWNGLPSYARTEVPKFPSWKMQFIRQNREFYSKHKRWIDRWLPQILKFPPSLQKLEWNCKGEKRDIWNYVIQFRASGVRVKRPSTAPSLVAMTTTQVPIIAWEKRYMTPRECANLQSLADIDHLPTSANRAFKALGNAINADVVQLIARTLLRT